MKRCVAKRYNKAVNQTVQQSDNQSGFEKLGSKV